MSPVQAVKSKGTLTNVTDEFFHNPEKSRIAVSYLAKLLGAGNESHLRYALKKQMAGRLYRRWKTVGDVEEADMKRLLTEADTTEAEAEAIYRLTSLCTFKDRFHIPPAHREEAVEARRDPLVHKQSVGFGFIDEPDRGF